MDFLDIDLGSGNDPATGDDADKRRLLRVLGDSALEEHAEWILIHRERSIDEKESLKLA